MSAIDSAALGSGLPVVNQAFEPKSVRDGSAATKQAYATALGFESLLVNRLAQQLASSANLMGSSDGSDGSSGSDSASSEFASLLPGALTDSIMADGGLGIAQSLMGSLDPQSTSGGAPKPGASAGVGK
jgi:hypothetical protein